MGNGRSPQWPPAAYRQWTKSAVAAPGTNFSFFLGGGAFEEQTKLFFFGGGIKRQTCNSLLRGHSDIVHCT